MKHFHLESGMTTPDGVFHPTGYMVLMFPTEHQAEEAARRLDEVGFDEDEVWHASPEEFLREVPGLAGDDTARRFSQLARAGHHALLVHAPSRSQSEHVMEVLREAHISYGQKYRQQAIEDLI